MFRYVKANRILADKVEYPLHLGVTEAGTLYRGTVKSAIGIGSLLLDGIGDTVRISLTDDPLKEVRAAKEILSSVGCCCGYACCCQKAAARNTTIESHNIFSPL